jgi:flagellar motor switch protein FliM
VELQAVLGHAEFTLDELASLRAGDIITLDRRVQEPIDIVIDARPVLRARTGLAGQQVALEVVGAAHEEELKE